MKKLNFSVSIVLPNWNGKHLLEKNLPAVIAAAKGAQIIIADDASMDGSVAFVRNTYPTIHVIENKTQLGFSGNVNSGVAAARGDIVVLLNTDVKPDTEFLVPLLARFSDPHIAAVGCLEKSHEAEHIVLRGRGIARWEKGYFVHSRGEVDKTDTAWVTGGSAAFRRRIWNQFGGMDTLYNPFYWEDIDLSYNIRKAGYAVAFEPASVVHHFHEEGKIKTSYSKEDVKKIAYRNQYIFLWKNMSDADIVFAHCFWTPIRLMQALLTGETAMLEGYLLAIRKLPGIIMHRIRASRHWRKRDREIISS